jgi:hypothetical protein
VVEILVARQDVASDPRGEALGRYLAAHIALDRAVHRRVGRAQLTALLGAPLWMAIVLSWPRGLAGVATAGFAVAATALFSAIAGEVSCRRTLRELSAVVRLQSVAVSDPPRGDRL